MKKVLLGTLSPKWLMISAVVGIFSYIFYSAHQIFFNEQYYSYNRYLIQLGNRQTYVLKKSISKQQSEYYYLQPKTETYSTATKTGYAIGKTDVELEQFLNSKVYIYGTIEKNRSPLGDGQMEIVVRKIKRAD